MRIIGVVAVSLLLCAPALAKPAPVEPQAPAFSPSDAAIFTGPAGAMLEQNYFQTPETPTTTGRLFPCRLKLQIFEKTRLAQTCH